MRFGSGLVGAGVGVVVLEGRVGGCFRFAFVFFWGLRVLFFVWGGYRSRWWGRLGVFLYFFRVFRVGCVELGFENLVVGCRGYIGVYCYIFLGGFYGRGGIRGFF